jgi:hypothetical protein
MSFLTTSSSVKGSAVMTATKSSSLNTFLLAAPGANYGAAFYPESTIPFLLEGNAGQYSCSLSIEVKGPGNYKWRGAIQGSAEAEIVSDMQYDTNFCPENLVDQITDNFGDQRLWNVPTRLGPSGQEAGIAVVSANGEYEVKIKCNGATNPDAYFVIGFMDSAGLLTEFKFAGFSHGEAVIKFTKA